MLFRIFMPNHNNEAHQEDKSNCSENSAPELERKDNIGGGGKSFNYDSNSLTSSENSHQGADNVYFNNHANKEALELGTLARQVNITQAKKHVKIEGHNHPHISGGQHTLKGNIKGINIIVYPKKLMLS